jgi:hypothetical protein
MNNEKKIGFFEKGRVSQINGASKILLDNDVAIYIGANIIVPGDV